MEHLVDGCCTVTDATMARYAALAWRRAGLRLEPSAAAALAGPAMVREAGFPALSGRSATHILWATGGSLLPEAEFAAVLAAGEGSAPDL